MTFSKLLSSSPSLPDSLQFSFLSGAASAGMLASLAVFVVGVVALAVALVAHAVPLVALVVALGAAEGEVLVDEVLFVL